MAYFPFMMEIGGKEILIIGGGPVALRKCELFLDYGARVTVVSPDLCPGLAALRESGGMDGAGVGQSRDGSGQSRAESGAGGGRAEQREPALTWIQGEYSADLLTKEVFAVVAATADREVNRRIYGDCQASRLPVNVVDDPELCGFIVPALVRRGDLSIAVSTGGKSPSLAGKLRRELEKRYDESYGERLELLGRYRAAVLRGALPIEEKRQRLGAAAELPLEELRRLAKG